MLIWSEDLLWEHYSINYLIPTVRLIQEILSYFRVILHGLVIY